MLVAYHSLAEVNVCLFKVLNEKEVLFFSWKKDVVFEWGYDVLTVFKNISEKIYFYTECQVYKSIYNMQNEK